MIQDGKFEQFRGDQFGVGVLSTQQLDVPLSRLSRDLQTAHRRVVHLFLGQLVGLL